MHDASVGPARSQSIVDGLTLTEKAALLSGKNFWQTRGYPHLGLPSLSLADGSHGVRKQLGSADHLGLSESEKATSFPTMATLANSWDVMLVEEVGAAVGLEAAALGVDVLLGPGLNIKRTPLGGRNFEYLSEDPYLTGKLAAGHVRGVQSRGVAATPKHFVANSQELRRMVVSSVVDERTLREIYLTAFEIVVHEATPRVIMSSYNPVNGVYTNEHPHLLARLLRGEWGFEGAVVTDWGGSNSTVEAVRQGSSLEMPSPGLDSVRQLVAAVECGNLDEEILDARVREVVELALASHSVSELVESWDVDAHHVLARRAAESSIVLLKNTDRVLPLPAKSRVGVIGDFAAHPRDQGAGSSVVNPTKVVTPLDALAVSPIDVVGFAQGFLRDGNPDEGLAQQAENLADDCDVVLVYLGLAEASETEGRDRRQLSLAQNQIDLLARLRTRSARIVVVLSAGSVVEIPWLGNCDALVHGYLGGQAGAEAVINVLTGEVNPSGKLAETYPIRLEDMPAFGYFPGLEKTAEYREGIFVGYRYYETADVPVRFPFGFGLSYTEFKYTNLIVDENSASFTITNTGLVAGAEIAQLYVGGTTGGTFRAAKELKIGRAHV